MSSRRHDRRCPKCQRFIKRNISMQEHWDEQCEYGDNEIDSGVKKSFEVHEDGTATAQAQQKNRVITLDQLIEVTDTDLEKWTVASHRINSWEMGYKRPDGSPGHHTLYQVRANLKPRQDLIDARAIIEDAISDLSRSAPDYDDPDYPYAAASNRNKQHMVEINISDHHLGMLAWGVETLGEDYDSKIAESLFLWAVKDLVHKASGFETEQYLFVVGNDIVHTDKLFKGKSGATTKGTPQDVDTRRKKMARIVRRMLVTSIDYLRERAPVLVVMVPGNHDQESVFDFGEIFKAWYRNDDQVRIDNNPPLRKYVHYGNTLLGFTHGAHETIKRLPMLMPLEQPDEWANTFYREWHIGHQHSKKRRDVISVNEEEGVRIRTFPSLASPDAWHAEKGYKGAVKAAEAYVWNKETGFSAMFSSNARASGVYE